jgi:hypothetical protein
MEVTLRYKINVYLNNRDHTFIGHVCIVDDQKLAMAMASNLNAILAALRTPAYAEWDEVDQ